jgi:hypothetical protein
VTVILAVIIGRLCWTLPMTPQHISAHRIRNSYWVALSDRTQFRWSYDNSPGCPMQCMRHGRVWLFNKEYAVMSHLTRVM